MKTDRLRSTMDLPSRMRSSCLLLRDDNDSSPIAADLRACARWSLGSLALALALVVELPAPAATNEAPKRVNILFLMDDQHRGDWVGAAGASWIITPNLDRLAGEGVLFRRAYTSVPSCYAARAALLTGMSPWQHGCLGYTPIPQRYTYEKPRLFTEAGWHTQAIGKQHFTPPRNQHGYQSVLLEESWYPTAEFTSDYQAWFLNRTPGMDLHQGYLHGNDQRGGLCYPLAEELHETRWTADQAVQFLEDRHSDAPWFLKVSFTHPHTPLNPPQRWYDRYASVSIPSPDVGRWARDRFGDVRTSFAQNPGASRGIVPDEEIRATRRSYAAAISFVDEQLGRIIAALEKRGELDNTLILFTADHGDMMGDHLLYRKTYPYEGSVRVPLIVRWPGCLNLKARRGQVREELTELRDVLPTFLDAAGLQVPPTVEGMSLLDVLRGKSGRTVLDLEHSSCYEPKDGWVGLLGPRYKYIYFEHTGKQQLFDLSSDPKELHDLALAPGSAQLVQEWRHKMIQHLAVRGEPWVVAGDLAVQAKSIGWRKNNPNVGK